MANNKSSAHLMSLSASWQALFITAGIVSWLSMVAAMILNFMESRYVSGGTLTFQITLWMQPVVFLLIAFALLGHYRPLMKRIFMSFLAASIGMALYGSVVMWGHALWNNLYALQHPVGFYDTSWWSAFGFDWTMMLAGLVVFGAGLYVATRKARR